MTKRRKMTLFSGILFLSFPLLFITWLNYIVNNNEHTITYTKGLCPKKEPIQKMFDGTIHKGLMQVAELAMLSNLVYHRKGTEKPTEFLGWRKSPIAPIKAKPVDKSTKILDDFYYEIWELEMGAHKKNIAIVFRGTQSLKDWQANARWITQLFDRGTYDHYDQLKEISKNLIKGIKNQPNNKDKELTFIATGHSLGGGLAQFMAYAVPEVKLVLAFNPSPVTGYYDLDQTVRIDNSKGVHIYRIYESGEFLSYVRDALMFLYPHSLFSEQDPSIARIRYSFRTGENAISQHGIEDMAKKLISLKKDTVKGGN